MIPRLIYSPLRWNRKSNDYHQQLTQDSKVVTKSLLPTAIDRAMEEKELPDLKTSLVQLQNPERCDSITDQYLKTSFLVMINPNSLALYIGDGQLCDGQADLAGVDTGRR